MQDWSGCTPAPFEAECCDQLTYGLKARRHVAKCNGLGREPRSPAMVKGEAPPHRISRQPATTATTTTPLFAMQSLAARLPCHCPRRRWPCGHPVESGAKGGRPAASPISNARGGGSPEKGLCEKCTLTLRFPSAGQPNLRRPSLRFAVMRPSLASMHPLKRPVPLPLLATVGPRDHHGPVSPMVKTTMARALPMPLRSLSVP